jgi:hypothetical protein
MPSGEGFRVYAIKESTDKELRTRRINRTCLFSFRGCDGLCELIPDAVPVLIERHRSWGGCCSVPPSWYELKNDDCRSRPLVIGDKLPLCVRRGKALDDCG